MSFPAPPAGWPNDLTQPVYFANSQWAVTAYGLECLERGAPYAAEGSRMNETRPGSDLYDWPLHMAEKSWVDIEAFIQAFETALHRFCPKDFDEKLFARTATQARQLNRDA